MAEACFYGWLFACAVVAAYLAFFFVHHALYVGAHAAEDDRIIEGWERPDADEEEAA